MSATIPSSNAASETPETTPSLRERLGWNHRGFRADRRGAAIGLALLLLVPATLDIIGGARFGLEKAYGDLRIFLHAARNYDLAANPDETLYVSNPSYLYPPFFITAITPLARLPDNVAVPIYQAIKWLTLYIALLAAWRLCSRPEEDVPPLAAIGALILSARFILNDIGIGNINTFIAASVIFSGYFVLKRQPILAGVIAGVATCVKITPVIVLAYFVYRGWWKTLIGAALAGVICLLIWPAIALGWETNLAALAEWNHYILNPYLKGGIIPSWIENQSLSALLNRLFLGYPLDGELPWRTAILSERVVSLIRLSIMGLLGLTFLWTTWRKLRPQRTPLTFAAELGLVQVAMLVLSVISWKAHFVGLLLPYAVLAAFVVDGRYSKAARRAAGAWLLASFVFCTLTGDIVTQTGVYYAELFGAMLWSALCAGGGLIVVCRSTPNDGIETKPSTIPEAT